MKPVVVGVISDTHGLLRPEAVSALAGVDRIVHAGDVGREDILRSLEAVAPITVVRGNVDHDAWARRLPQTAVLEVAGVRVYVVHDLATLDIEPKAAGVHVVVSGHSHVPRIDQRDGVTYLNPGSAGPRRFTFPVTVAKLWVEGGRASAKIIEVVTHD
jgi:putative phosphoesterase